jgi:hypothetical protein
MKLLVACLILAVALTAGYWLGHAEGSAATLAAASQSLATQRTEIARLSATIATLRSGQRTAAPLAERGARADRATMPESVRKSDRLGVLMDLKQRNLTDAGVSLLTWDGKLDPAFVDLFELTELEQQALTDTIGKAQAEIARLQVASAKVTRPNAATVVIEVPPTPEGDAIETSVFDTLERVLGPERQRAFDVLARRDFVERMSAFGAEQRTITIVRNDHPIDAESRYTLKDVKWAATATEAQGETMTTAIGTLAEFTPDEKRFETLIPADFRDAKP